MNPQWRMHLSWLFLVAGALWGANLAHANPGPGNPIMSALLSGYILWSMYWGMPTAWGWCRRSVFQMGGMVTWLSGGCFVQMLIAFFVLCVGGYLYSVFGGGLYQFARCWRAAKYTI